MLARFLASAAVALALSVTPPAEAQMPTEVFPTVSNPRVLEDFGGIEGIRALMEEFSRTLLENPRTRPSFAGRDLTRLKAQLTDQVCQILGGGCVYTGRTMRESHRDLAITEGQFNALVEAFQDAMDRRGIPFASQNRLLAILAPMSRDIITR